MYDEVVQEYWLYEWKKSKAKLWEVEAFDKYSDLPEPDWCKNGSYVFVIEEQQLYRCKHTRKYKKVS